MQIKSFVIPCSSGPEAEEELNKFLRSQRVLVVDRHFSESLGGWAVLVQYQDGEATRSSAFDKKDAKDYSKELAPQEYERFLSLKKARAELAKTLNCPVYLILTNEEAARLSKFEKITPELIKTGVKGVPQRRLTDYGPELMRLIEKYAKEEAPEESQKVNSPAQSSDNEESGLFDGEDIPFG